jgi:hypothetical protein
MDIMREKINYTLTKKVPFLMLGTKYTEEEMKKLDYKKNLENAEKYNTDYSR